MQLGAPQGDGATLREHLRRVWRNTRRLNPLLAEARRPLPATVEYLWQWFLDLSASRPPVLNGAATPISCVELEAWQRLNGVQLTPWEFDTVRAMDRAAIAAFAAQARTRAPSV